MIGLLYLKAKRNWRAWLKITLLASQSSSLIRSLQHRKRETDVIISLTTIHTRIKSVEQTIRSIIAGTCLPEGVYLYLDEKTFTAITAQKSFLTPLVDAGFVHFKVVKDLRSYKKFVYALAEYPEKFIVVCDDDVLYPKYWLSALLETYRKWSDPKIIVCHRAHIVSFEKDGKPKPYLEWSNTGKKIKNPNHMLFPTGTGGVLYPPKSMPAITYDSELFLKYAPTADDIWFWFCALSNGCRFTLTEYPFNPTKFPEVPGSQVTNLFSINVFQNGNDQQMNNCLEFFQQRAEFSEVSRLFIDIPVH